MRRLLLLVLTGLMFSALIPGLLSAQPDLSGAVSLKPGAAEPPDVVVTGRPEPKPDEVRRQARAVSQIEDLHHAPLARFQDPVCPGIVGLPADVASLMIDRIRDNAARIGIETAREDSCRPNILILFPLNGQREVRALKAQDGGSHFRGISSDELRTLADDPGPVHAWVNTAMRTRHGEAIQGDRESGVIPQVVVPMGDSHIFFATRRDITASVVMIDMKAIDGLSVVQLADYATMRVMARTRPANGDGAVGTILSLFDPGDGPRPYEMTDFDIAYLKALYGPFANLPAATKIAAVARALRDEKAMAD